MKAKLVNEIQKFERGIDPKKAMKIGKHRFTDFEGYVEEQCKEHDLDSSDFWEEWNDMKLSSCDSGDLLEEIQDAIRHTPIEHQIKWIAGDLEMWIEDKT